MELVSISLFWSLVVFAKGLASTNVDLGFFEHNHCADKLQVIMCFRLNTSSWNL
jgi:hypothetical protein